MGRDPRQSVARVLGLLRTEAEAVAVLHRAGLTRARPAWSVARAQQKWKGVLAGGYAAWAEVTPDRVALIDEKGSLTFREVHQRTNAVAHGLAAEGVVEGDSVAVLCRNHRGFLDASVAACKVGARVVFFNTGFAGPQLREVLDREGCVAVLFDDEFRDTVTEHAGDDRLLVLAEETVGDSLLSVGDLFRRHLHTDPPPPHRPERLIVLTSGTTGTPKGANRPRPRPLPSSGAVMFSRIPYRVQDTLVVSAPMFHAWGMGQMLVAQNTGSTIVLRRRFDPEATLALVAEHRADVLAVVPVMLKRILALDPAVTDRHDTSSLRIVACSGSALPGRLATAWMDRFGDNLYNFYGSTEVAQATVATPEDMRAAPGTAGRPPLGTVVKLLDDDGHEVRGTGAVGRIFVGSSLQFEGYTGGGGKEVVDGLMSTGDLGWFDDEGRLFVGGRDDDMIVSGGENVFPREVEDLLADHPGVDDVAVVGVDDPEWGQRLRAFVVRAEETEPRVTETELRQVVRERLASYKVPREVVFIDEIPRNPTGKILRRALQS